MELASFNKESKITTHMGRAMPHPGSGGFSGKKSWKIKPEEKAGGAGKGGDQTLSMEEGALGGNLPRIEDLRVLEEALEHEGQVLEFPIMHLRVRFPEE